MMIRAGSWVRDGLLVLVAAVGLPDTSARAQYNPGANAGLGAPMPQLPPKGAWGEVIMVNNKWIVIQNQQGQQFPISMQGGMQFLVRWPTTRNALTRQSVVEAMGEDVGSNTLRAEHIDVYEGPAQSLVSPTLRSLLDGNNRPVTTIDPSYSRSINGFDAASQGSLYGWTYPVAPGSQGIPARLYAVGEVADLDPLRLRVPGNNVATVLPAAGNMSMTQVTRGSSSFARKGDLAFMMPIQVMPKTLVLSQLVIYKKMPLSQYVP